MNKKILIVSIIAVVILVLVSFTGVVGYQSTKSLDVNENITTNTNRLPDVKIKNVKIKRRMAGNGDIFYGACCVVKNIGRKTTGPYYSIQIEVDVYEARISSPDNYYGHHYGALGSSDPLDPGESVFIYFYSSYDIPFPGSFLRFECQLTCDFEEKNTDNNYFEKTYFKLFHRWLFPLPILF